MHALGGQRLLYHWPMLHLYRSTANSASMLLYYHHDGRTVMPARGLADEMAAPCNKAARELISMHTTTIRDTTDGGSGVKAA